MTCPVPRSIHQWNWQRDEKTGPVVQRTNRGVRTTLLALFFCSGICGLIFEVVWTRQLTVILGNTVYAVSTVLTVFMTGLALGSYFGGRLIDRRHDALRVYAILEITIGVLGFLLSMLLRQTGPTYVWIHQSLSGYPLALSMARYVFAFALLVIPTTLMGATLPVLSRFIVSNQRDVGFDTGRLYALNTVGAAVGCFAAGFLLIGVLGIEGTVRVAAALGITVGGTAWWCWIKLRPDSHLATVPAENRSESAAAHWTWLRVTVLVAFAVSGLAALGYEVVWTRLLTRYLGNSIYAFCAMLTTFLAGMALGSLVFSRIASRSKRTVMLFGLIEVAIALYVLLFLMVFGWSLHRMQAWMQPDPWWDNTSARFLRTFAVMFLPTFLMGAAFPVAGQTYVRNLRQLGQRLGELYASNTLGAIIGSALAGFVLLPHLGLQGSLVVLLVLNLSAGVALCAMEPAWSGRQRRWLSLSCCWLPDWDWR